MRFGFTLLELAVVITLLGLAGSAVLPAARQTADRAAVVGAREAVAGLVARTRVEATLLGGAALHVRARDGTVWVEALDSVIELRRLGAEFGVTVEVGGADGELRFDALGLGRRASRTIVLRRRDALARLVVAAYGRAVRS